MITYFPFAQSAALKPIVRALLHGRDQKHAPDTFSIGCLSLRHQMYMNEIGRRSSHIPPPFRPYFIQSGSLRSKINTEQIPSIATYVAVKACPDAVFQMTTLSLCYPK